MARLGRPPKTPSDEVPPVDSWTVATLKQFYLNNGNEVEKAVLQTAELSTLEKIAQLVGQPEGVDKLVPAAHQIVSQILGLMPEDRVLASAVEKGDAAKAVGIARESVQQTKDKADELRSIPLGRSRVPLSNYIGSIHRDEDGRVLVGPKGEGSGSKGARPRPSSHKPSSSRWERE